MNKNRPKEMNSIEAAVYAGREIRKLDIRIAATDDPAKVKEYKREKRMWEERRRHLLGFAKRMLPGNIETVALNFNVTDRTD